MIKYAFEIKTLIMVEAESEDEAWDLVKDETRTAVDDFAYERSPEDDELTLSSDFTRSALITAPKYKINNLPEEVDHPAHYTSDPSGIECIEITRHRNFNIGNAMKYLWRNGLKDSDAQIEDLQKAIWYIQDEIKRLNK